MKDRRMHHGATVMGNKLYVTGGRRLTTDCSIEDSASFDCYDPETDTWTSQGQLPHKLFDHACLTLQCIPHHSTVPWVPCPELRVQSLSHWTTREVPGVYSFCDYFLNGKSGHGIE